MLRSIVKGGTILATRNVVGMLLMLVGNVAIVRALGLSLFGLQSVSSFAGSVLTSVAELSIGLYIVRRPGTLTDSEVTSAFTLLQVASWIVAALGIFVVGPIAAWWYGHHELLWLVGGTSVAIVLAAPGKVPSALLEREMRYGVTSATELASTVAYYGTALLALAFDFGVWSLVFAELARALASTICASIARPMPYRLRLRRDEVRSILRFGASMSSSTWVWMLASGVNPLVIGKVLGVEAAGLVRLAQGLLNQTSTFASALSRISINVFGKIQEQPETVLRAVNTSAVYAFAAISLPSLALVAASPWLMPKLYHVQGPAITNLLLLAVLPQVINAVLMSQSFLLMARGEGTYLTKLHVIRSCLVWLGCLVFVGRFGVYAAPLGDLVGVAALVLLHRRTRELYGAPDYRPAAVLVLVGYGATVAVTTLMGPFTAVVVLAAVSLACFALVLHLTGDRVAQRAIRAARQQLRMSIDSGVA